MHVGERWFFVFVLVDVVRTSVDIDACAVEWALGAEDIVGVVTRDRDFSGCSGRGFGSPNN